MIKDKFLNKVYEVQSQAAGIAQNKFIQWVMKEEDCSYEEAYAICTGHTDPREPVYTLGFKLSDPVWELAIFKQRNRKKRAQAADNFRQLLEPDELILFDEQVNTENARKQFNEEYKEKKKDPKKSI